MKNHQQLIDLLRHSNESNGTVIVKMNDRLVWANMVSLVTETQAGQMTTLKIEAVLRSD